MIFLEIFLWLSNLHKKDGCWLYHKWGEYEDVSDRRDLMASELLGMKIISQELRCKKCGALQERRITRDRDGYKKNEGKCFKLGIQLIEN